SRSGAPDGRAARARLQRGDGAVAGVRRRRRPVAGHTHVVHPILRCRAAVARLRGRHHRRTRIVLGRAARRHRTGRRPTAGTETGFELGRTVRAPAVLRDPDAAAVGPRAGAQMSAVRTLATCIVVAALVPFVLDTGMARLLGEMLLMLAMAQMWNLL